VADGAGGALVGSACTEAGFVQLADASLRSAEPSASRAFSLSPNLIGFQLAGFADYVAYFGEVVFFLRRREGDGGV